MIERSSAGTDPHMKHWHADTTGAQGAARGNGMNGVQA
jgi:hypothetical protein